MNRNTKISLSIIFILLAVIIVHKNKDRFGSNIPELKKWSDSADSILIKKVNDTLKLYKKNNKWVINDQAYLAMQSEANKLENKMRDLNLQDFISKKKLYSRFDLDEKAIQVVVKKNSKVLRDILIGKASTTGQQVYVKFSKNSEVYLASGNLRSDFNKTVDALREKNMLTVNVEEINSIDLVSKRDRFTLVKKPVNGKKESKNKKEEWVVKNKSVLKLDQNKVADFLRSFAVLNAESFTEKKYKIKSELFKTSIQTTGKIYTFDILLKEKDDKYVCKSSESEYLFLISKYQAEQFLKTLKDFM